MNVFVIKYVFQGRCSNVVDNGCCPVASSSISIFTPSTSISTTSETTLPSTSTLCLPLCINNALHINVHSVVE